MSDPTVKGMKRSPSSLANRRTSSTSSSKKRTPGVKAARAKPMKKKPAKKAPARKATRGPLGSTTKGDRAKRALSAKTKNQKKAKPAARKSAASSRSTVSKAKKRVTRVSSSRKTQKKRPSTVAKPKRASRPAVKSPAKRTAASKQTTASKRSVNLKGVRPQPSRAIKPAQPPPVPVPRVPTRDEAAALHAFERAHREFKRGRFAEAGSMFRALVEKHPGVAEVAARGRTYLAISEARLRREISLPRDADSLYDRGVIELNRGEYVAAQEMFERALKREPGAAHIHYGLAATRARLGALDSALQSLQKALGLQPTLRVRAQHDQDLSALRNDPEFEQLVFAPRF